MLLTIKNIEQKVTELTRHGDTDAGHWVYTDDIYGEPIEVGDTLTTLTNGPTEHLIVSENDVHSLETDGTAEDYETYNEQKRIKKHNN